MDVQRFVTIENYSPGIDVSNVSYRRNRIRPHADLKPIVFMFIIFLLINLHIIF